MKIKINWGWGIVIAMALFMAFILQYVYRVSVYDKYDHHLVADDYYKDELNYQKEIDNEENANSLVENVKILKTDDGLSVVFPKEFKFDKVSGEIKLMRPSNYKLDIKKEIKLNSNSFLILDKELATGRYDISINWIYKDKKYLYKTAFYY
jgi:hypothetical protein